MSSVVKSRKVLDLGAPELQDPSVRYSNSIVRGCQPQPECVDSQCLNGCVCSADKSFCDNTMLPFHGTHCETSDVGFKFYVENVPGQVTFDYESTRSTSKDKISFGFITCHPDGTFAKLSGAYDNEFIKIYLQDGRVAVDYNLGGRVQTMKTSKKYDDSKLYAVQFTRNGGQSELTVIDLESKVADRRDTVATSGNRVLDGVNRLEIGSETVAGSVVNGFRGIMFGFKHDRYAIFNLAKVFQSQTSIRQPGTQIVTKSPEKEFKCEIPGDAMCGPGLPKCQNFGVCMDNRCNCTLTAFAGDYCTEEPEGHYYGYNNFKPGIVIHDYPEPITTYEDYFAVGFMTYEPTGTIFRIQSSDNTQYYQVRLVGGKAQLEYNLNSKPEVITEINTPELHSNESIYHVIRMNRTGDTITFNVDGYNRTVVDRNIANIAFRNQEILTTGAKLSVNDVIEDDWNGILAGLYYNGKMWFHVPITASATSTYRGDVELAPHPFKLRLPEPPKCSRCYHQGIPLPNGLCDCTYTTYGGECCNSMVGLYGFRHKKFGSNSVIVYTNSSMGGSRVDDLSVGFRSARGWGDGEILKIESEDGRQFILVDIVGENLRVLYNLDGVNRSQIYRASEVTNKDKDHILQLHRNGRYGWLRLDANNNTVLFGSSNIFDAYRIYVGGVSDGKAAKSGFYGLVWGLVYNGNKIIDITRSADAGEKGIKLITDSTQDFEIVEWKWPELCDKGSTDVECNLPTTGPTGAPGGAGAIVPAMGGIEPPKAPVVVLPPPVPTAPIGAIIGAVMGGLLFSSAIAWAAAGMKPGFLALSKRLAGAAGKGSYAPVSVTDGKFPVSGGGSNYLGTVGLDEMGGSQAGSRRSQYDETFTQESRFEGGDGMGNGLTGMGTMNGGGGYNTYNTTSSWYTRNEMMENQQQGYGGGGGGYAGSMHGYGTGRNGYAGSVAGGSISGSVYGFGTVTNPDQAFITLSEDIAVDNVVLTADGRYVVTGSNLGPPQVWNTNVRKTSSRQTARDIRESAAVILSFCCVHRMVRW